MSHISRRHFLQFTGSTLVTFGLSQLDIINKGNRYAQVLAQTTPRKLALLVGINNYPTNDRFFGNLKGCVTDVALQEELLIHRFGFNSNDIIKLTSDESLNKQPTRNNILTAFEEHLIKQAKPGDVVVFHFSGHGSQLRDPNPIQGCSDRAFNNEFNSTLVIADEGQKGLAPDIMGRTLFLLRSALNTENVTFVLDSCHSGGGTRGNFRVRSVPGDGLNPSPEEIAYQKRWMEQLQLTDAELARQRCAGGKGIVLASAQREEEALDAEFGDFSAGAFTYLMTQYLWQQTDNVGSVIAQISRSIRPLSRQVPLADGNQNQPVYFINKPVPPTDAVITKVEGDKATLWLGGVDKESLEAFQPGATFAIINDKGQPSGKLELVSPRSGLRGEAKLVEKGAAASLQPGMLLQEASRIIPASLKLSIGLDPSLVGETNAVKQALMNINRLEAIPAQSGNVPYPGGVQYIFSRLTAPYQRKLQQQQVANLPATDSIGLFTEGLEPVPESFGELGETVTKAVERLEPKLKALLAARILKMTLNANASELDMEVSMNLVEQPNQPLARTSTGRARNNRRELGQSYSKKLPLNQLFQFRVTNRESSALYFTTLLIDSTGGLVVIFPYQWPTSQESMRLEPNQTLLIGDPKQLQLKAIQKGTGEALVIASRSPLKNAAKTLAVLATELKRSEGPMELREPVDVIGDLLDDLRSDRGGLGVESRPVSASEMATLSITFEVS